MAVRNEAEVLPRKLLNLSEIDYPPDRCEMIVVSDGSTDGTNQVLAGVGAPLVGDRSVTAPFSNGISGAATRSAFPEPLEGPPQAGHPQGVGRLRALTLPQHQGKASALNCGIQAAKGEIVVFTDARQLIEPSAVRHLVANFADPAVGCVSGELILGEPQKGPSVNGVGVYWSMEKKIRQLESATGSVVGATGALYAIRRELTVPLPPGTILDDVYLPLHVVRQGRRVIFEPRGRAYDTLATGEQEFRRKVRTLLGNYQLLQLAPWLLTTANPVRFEFVCHKLLRLVVPFALASALVSSLLLKGVFFRLAFVLQLLFYGLATLAVFPARFGLVSRLANLSLAFVLLNTAAAVAFAYLVTGKKEVWAR
jgi:cellulose synthase/poly-beta-1,6-N-acetylglucosamine synthase-like glycosyltransferase